MSAVVKDDAPLVKLDRALKDFGMPVGPVTLADEVGIDVVVSHVSNFLSKADLGVRMFFTLESLLVSVVGTSFIDRDEVFRGALEKALLVKFLVTGPGLLVAYWVVDFFVSGEMESTCIVSPNACTL